MALRQVKITIKTADSTLTYAEMGDVIVNAETAVTITLPTGVTGLWYRIGSVGNGAVNVSDGTVTLTTISKAGQALFLASGDTWYMTKGGIDYTLPQANASALGGVKASEKAETDTQEVKIDASTGKLYTAPGSDSYTLPQATASVLGGIKADEKTSSETQEVKIDPVTGKLYTAPGGSSGALSFIELSDTPSSYADAAGKVIRVKATEDGVEFGNAVSVPINALYATISALETAHPTGSAGDAYAVGTDTDNVIYIWDSDTSAWRSIGSIKGPKGDAGASGATIWGGM